MARNVWGVASGLLVLVLGVVAVGGLLGGEEAPPEETAPIAAPTTATTQAASGQSPIAVVPELPGVSLRISRVLKWGGDAGFADEDEIGQLPPTVAEVLTHYGVPLRIATTGDEG